MTNNLPTHHQLLSVVIAFIFLLTLTWITTPNVQAACTSSNLNQGLISALSLTGASIGNTDQTCVLDPQSAYRDFKVPLFKDLEDQFYTLSRSTAKKSSQLGTGAINFSSDGIYLQTSSLSMSGPVTGSGVQILFIRGDLNITRNINYASNDPLSGLVIVTSGSININSNVTRVNAVLISFDRVCTAYESGACLTGGSIYTPQLVINGSLISLNKTNLDPGDSAIKLARNLQNNNQPAEVINKQPKYLYLLRNGLFTQDLILTEEDKTYSITADPIPPPVAPPPAPVCSGATDPLVILNNIPSIKDCVISIFDS